MRRSEATTARAGAELPRVLVVDLPLWPTKAGGWAPPLTANQRLHWAERHRRVATVRDTVAWRVRGQSPAEHVEVWMFYRPGDSRRRDADNLVPTLKAGCDGLVDSGLAEDDTPAQMTKHMPVLLPGRSARLWLEVVAA